MKNRKIFFLILFLVVGFASVSATLVINGVVKIGTNEQDFKIFFSEAILDDVDKSNSLIKDNKQVIDFETNELTLVNQVSVLDYEVTNNSRQYDARVEIHCAAKAPEILDYVELTYEIDKEIIPAKEKVRGIIKAKLKKPYTGDEEFDKDLTCTIGATAIEKGEANDIVLEENEYYTYGYLLQNDTSVQNQLVALISSNGEVKYTTTDARGMFIVENLDGGDYELLVIDKKTQSEVEGLTREDLENIATDSTSFNTKDNKITLTNYEIAYSKINAGSPTKHTVIFDTNEGTTENITSTIIEGEPIGYLPSDIDHEDLAFLNWEVSGEIIEEKNSFNSDITLNANFSEGVARIGEKQFRTLNSAFNYVKTKDETTIEVIKNNAVEKSIVTDKNIILDLNEKTVQFNQYDITSSGNLTIENGSIKADGKNVLINNGKLNLENNLKIEHINNIDVTDVDTIINNENGTLNINNTTAFTSVTAVEKVPSFMANYGTAVISNSEIELVNSNIYSAKGSTLILNDNNISEAFINFEQQMISLGGDCTINGGTFKVSEENETGYGIMSLYSTSTLTLNSGTLDNTYGKGNAIYTNQSSTLNMGEHNKEINIIGNNLTSYTISADGNVSIIDGTINALNGHFLNSNGKTLIGTKETTPTINGATGYRTLIYNKGTEHKIVNAKINGKNYWTIDVEPTAKLTIDYANITQTSTTSTTHSIYVGGDFVVNDGIYMEAEDNVTSSGLFYVASTGVLTINSGTIDNTYGKGFTIYTRTSSTLNIGKKDNDINLIGNETDYYTISSLGNVNILDGTINTTKGHFIGSYGKLTIGTKEATPTIIGAPGKRLLEIRSNEDNKIINGNISATNMSAACIYQDAKLTIDNSTITQTNSTALERLFNVVGELIINDGTYKIKEDNATGNGLFTIQSTGTLTINSGTFDNSYGKGNAIYGNASSTLNIGEHEKETNIIGNNSTFYTISSAGNVNIIDGTINAFKGFFLNSTGKTIIGSEETTPTINGPTGFTTLIYRNGTEHKIVNAKINGQNSYIIDVQEPTAELTIDNIDITLSNSTSTSHMINVEGKLLIKDGMYKVAEDNKQSQGLFTVFPGGELTIESGTFDNTHGIGNAFYTFEDSTLNLGKKDSTIIIKGNSPESYIMGCIGETNIIDGTIISDNGPFMLSLGKVIVGSKESTPNITGLDESPILMYGGGEENRIINANITSSADNIIYVYQNAKLLIDNANISQINAPYGLRMFMVYGELTINNGLYSSNSENGEAQGLLSIGGTGVLNIDGGTFNYNGPSNLSYTVDGGTFNIGQNEKNPISINSTNARSYPMIANRGNLNIYSGTLLCNNVNAIVQKFSEDDDELTTSEERLNYPATINIYGGYIENNSNDKPTISLSAGKLNMFDGEVVNKGSNFTIANSGGTAIQTGGISRNNKNVTVE